MPTGVFVLGVGHPAHSALETLRLRSGGAECPSPMGWIPALGGRNDGERWVGMIGVG